MFDSPHYVWPLLLVAFVLIGLSIILFWMCKLARSARWRPVGRLRAINVYPLKSGAATLVPYASCEFLGLRYKNLSDRMFVVFDDEGKVVTARTSPNLLRIKVLPTASPDRVRFTTTSGRDHFELDLTTVTTDTSTISMKFPTTETEVLHTRDCGEDAAMWISLELEKSGVRLGFWPHGFGRDIVSARPREVGVYNISNRIAGAYSNLSSYLMVNSASVDDLVERLGPGTKVTAANFRANILVYEARPYAEDTWEKLKIGNACFKIVKGCVRCMMVTIDPKTLEQEPNNEPLTTLKTYRQLTDPELRSIEGDSPVMGCYMGLSVPGDISAGEVVYALSHEPQESSIFRMFKFF